MPVRLLKYPIQLSKNYMRLRYGQNQILCSDGLTSIQLDILNLIESKKRSSVQEIQSKFKLSEEIAEKEVEYLVGEGWLIDKNNPSESHIYYQ